ncbi:MAG: RagB/SusD family nutrient uptake outer membrane protein [Prolixibacteraceae bacterium]|nr:RagB/SusD family nutrient uptake outer membrane protein [Prolixibacteraceae bacterium]
MKNIKMYRYTTLLALLALMLAFTSCEDLFDQKAGNKITPDEHYKSVKDLEISMQGVLTPLKEAMPKLILLDGLLSDQMEITANADVDMQELNDHVFSINNPYLDGSDLYKVIINANEVLMNLYKITEVDPDFDEYFISSYTNYLIGMRSWAYFTLVKLNGEAAWIEGNMSSLPEKGLSYIPKEAMLDTLINQLLPNIHTDESTDELQLSLYINTKALLGEIYLEKNDYANAVTYLKLGLESFGNDKKFFKLDKTHSKEAWEIIFLNAENNNTENICVIPFKSTEGQVNPVTGWTLITDEYKVKPSSVITNMYLNQYPTKGPKGDAFRGVGASIDTTANGETYILKYAIDIGEPYGADIIISRAADLHLLLAEALNRTGDYQGALILMNDGYSRVEKVPRDYLRWNTGLGVRGRVNLLPRPLPEDITEPAKIMEWVENVIIDERSMELAFEGKRYFDLMRIARRRNNPDFLASKVASKFSDSAKKQQIKEKLWNPDNWYIPLNK